MNTRAILATLTITAAAITGCSSSGNLDGARTEAERITTNLDAGFNCNWNQDSDNAPTIRWSCPNEQIIVITSDSRGAIETVVDGINDDVGVGYAILTDDYAIVTVDQGTRNQAWDLLGAEGELITFD